MTDSILKLLTNFDLLNYFDNAAASRPMILVADFFQALFIAAMVEELCKYYAFRTVEHPDLIFLTGLNRHKRDKRSGYGGSTDYAFSSDNNAMISRNDTFDSEYSKRRCDSPRSYRGNSQSPNGRKKRSSTTRDDMDESDIRTLRQKAAAVTTAMISCAVGLACAENFIYVFFLSGSNTQEEITMLVFRSIFPVHALCAAMQSVGVIKKFLEDPGNTNSLGVGKIVLPAIVLHGSFDGILMTVNSLIDIEVEDAQNKGGQGDYNFGFLDLIAASAVITVMLVGVAWYYTKNREQKSKLKVWENSSPAGHFINDGNETEDGIELL